MEPDEEPGRQPEEGFAVQSVRTAAERLNEEVFQDQQTIHGTMRGVTLETGKFDLLNNAEDLITGTVADDFAEEDLDRISSLTNKRCVAKLEKTEVRRIGGTPTTTYVLIDAQAESGGTP
jgi:hypothetical protein